MSKRVRGLEEGRRIKFFIRRSLELKPIVYGISGLKIHFSAKYRIRTPSGSGSGYLTPEHRPWIRVLVPVAVYVMPGHNRIRVTGEKQAVP
jgi:hypothetical protein